jgi:hypothetical protein
MNRTVRKLFLFLLIFSPLAFGTVEQWSLTIMETLSLTALCLLLIHNLRANDSRLYEIPGILPLTIFFAYMLFQLMPLPSSIIRLLSPGVHEVYSNTVWIVDPAKWVSISLNRKATLLEFLRLLSYAAFYVLAVQLMTKKEFFQKAVSLLGVFASLLALFAIIQHFSFNERIYWLRALTQGGTPK